MSLIDTITGLATGTFTVTRRAAGVFTDGVYVPGATTSTFTVVGVDQPATGLQRVVGGRDMKSSDQNQRTDDVRSFYCETELYARSATHDPDEIALEEGDWTVFRVEKWNLAGTVFYFCVLTRKAYGAA